MPGPARVASESLPGCRRLSAVRSNAGLREGKNRRSRRVATRLWSGAGTFRYRRAHRKRGSLVVPVRIRTGRCRHILRGYILADHPRGRIVDQLVAQAARGLQQRQKRVSHAANPGPGSANINDECQRVAGWPSGARFRPTRPRHVDSLPPSTSDAQACLRQMRPVSEILSRHSRPPTLRRQ